MTDKLTGVEAIEPSILRRLQGLPADSRYKLPKSPTPAELDKRFAETADERKARRDRLREEREEGVERLRQGATSVPLDERLQALSRRRQREGPRVQQRSAPVEMSAEDAAALVERAFERANGK